MFGAETQPEALEPIDLPRFAFVRTTHVVPQFEEQCRDPAHPASGDTDQVNAVALTRQHLLEIEVRGERHDWVAYIFPSFQPRARRHFSAPGARKLPPTSVAPGVGRGAREFFAPTTRP